MITTAVDDAAYRLATMIDFCSALDWSAGSPPVLALMFVPADDPDDVRTVSFPLETPIPEAISTCEPDAECLAICVSAVFGPERHRRRTIAGHGTVRMTIAVTDCDAAAVYRYPNGRVNRTAQVGQLLRSQLQGMWDLRVRFELDRRRISSESYVDQDSAA